MEEWRVQFDNEQKKRFKDQEKKISKKINSKLSKFGAAMSADIDAKLEATQVKNTKSIDNLTDQINTLVSALTTLQQGHQVHGNTLVSLQDYTLKDNGK
eukprot:3065240-Ditylum_brightwellii.AAC.1